MKQFPLRLEQEIYEAFIRIFPDHGQRTFFLRAVVREVIKQVQINPELLNLPTAVRSVLTSAGMKIRTHGGGNCGNAGDFY